MQYIPTYLPIDPTVLQCHTCHSYWHSPTHDQPILGGDSQALLWMIWPSRSWCALWWHEKMPMLMGLRQVSRWGRGPLQEVWTWCRVVAVKEGNFRWRRRCSECCLGRLDRRWCVILPMEKIMNMQRSNVSTIGEVLWKKKKTQSWWLITVSCTEFLRRQFPLLISSSTDGRPAGSCSTSAAARQKEKGAALATNHQGLGRKLEIKNQGLLLLFCPAFFLSVFVS